MRPVDTGNAGATPAILKRSDIAIADHECPIMPDDNWKPNDKGTALVFAVPEAEVVAWEEMLGLDAVYLAANHMSDRGVAGIRSTIKILDKHKLPHTGLGMNLDEGLEPAYLEVAGTEGRDRRLERRRRRGPGGCRHGGRPVDHEGQRQRGGQARTRWWRRSRDLLTAMVGRPRVPRRPAARRRSRSSPGSTRPAAIT